MTDADLTTLLGLHQQEGIEAEHPDCCWQFIHLMQTEHGQIPSLIFPLQYWNVLKQSNLKAVQTY